MLELGEELLDRVEVGAVGRQEEEMGAGGPDGAAGGLSLVAAEVVEDDDVAFGEGRPENLLDLEGEELAVDRAVDDPGCVDAIASQGGDECGEALHQLHWLRLTKYRREHPEPVCRPGCHDSQYQRRPTRPQADNESDRPEGVDRNRKMERDLVGTALED